MLLWRCQAEDGVRCLHFTQRCVQGMYGTLHGNGQVTSQRMELALARRNALAAYAQRCGRILAGSCHGLLVPM
eukprot:1767105-Prymnesium_polylepis.3